MSIRQKSSLAGRKRLVGDIDSEEGEKLGDKRKKRKKKDVDDRENEVDDVIKKLKEKHGNANFTSMQYRIWAEMRVGGYHPSIDEPPTTTMFTRAGGATPKRKTTADVVSQAIGQLSSALSPRIVPLPSTIGNASSSQSPAKVIDNRSKCYRQLGELKNLKQSGLLSEEEYIVEREAIMNTLKTLGQ